MFRLMDVFISVTLLLSEEQLEVDLEDIVEGALQTA
jgi:hypothetical protein